MANNGAVNILKLYINLLQIDLNQVGTRFNGGTKFIYFYYIINTINASDLHIKSFF